MLSLYREKNSPQCRMQLFRVSSRNNIKRITIHRNNRFGSLHNIATLILLPYLLPASYTSEDASLGVKTPSPP